MVSSPCTKVCVIDGVSGLCFGCGRTLGEIANWGSLSEAERLAIMATLAERMKTSIVGLGIRETPSS